jgi:hypothetical protein
VDGGCGSQRQGGFSGLGRRWWLNVGVLRLQEDEGTLHEDILILLSASMVVSSGGRWRVIAAARAVVVVQFWSKIFMI